MGTLSPDDLERIRHWPDLSFHYPALGFEEIARMPNGVRRVYEDELPRLIAEAEVRALNAAAYPHLDRSGKRSLERRLERRLRRFQEPAVTKFESQEEFQKHAAAAGIGLKLVDADGNEVT